MLRHPGIGAFSRRVRCVTVTTEVAVTMAESLVVASLVALPLVEVEVDVHVEAVAAVVVAVAVVAVAAAVVKGAAVIRAVVVV